MRNILTATGRMKRKDFLIFNLLFSIPFLFIELIDIDKVLISIGFKLILAIVVLILGIINAFQIIKRFHDIEYNGWCYLLLLIPIVNIGGVFLLLFKDGTKGPNKYGDDPKGRIPEHVCRQAAGNTGFIILIISLYIPFQIFSQSFEGEVYYKKSYIPNYPWVKTKYLEQKYGNAETYYFKGKYSKKIEEYNSDTLSIEINNNIDSIEYYHWLKEPYYIKYNIEDDKIDLKRLENTVWLNSQQCAIYQESHHDTITTYYLLESDVVKPIDYSYYDRSLTKLKGLLLRVKIEYPDYTTVLDYISHKEKTIDIAEFNTGNYIVATDYEEYFKDPAPDNLKSLHKCFHDNIKFPGYMKLYNLRGQIFVDLIFDSTGAVKDIEVTPNFFKKNYGAERIYNIKRENRINRIIAKRIVKNYMKCTNGKFFNFPETKDNKKYFRIASSYGSVNN